MLQEELKRNHYVFHPPSAYTVLWTPFDTNSPPFGMHRGMFHENIFNEVLKVKDLQCAFFQPDPTFFRPQPVCAAAMFSSNIDGEPQSILILMYNPACYIARGQVWQCGISNVRNTQVSITMGNARRLLESVSNTHHTDIANECMLSLQEPCCPAGYAWDQWFLEPVLRWFCQYFCQVMWSKSKMLLQSARFTLCTIL